MEKAYKILYEGGIGEIIEKKSRFIATVIPIETEEEIQEKLEEIKKKYWNASHNCYAYVLGDHAQKQRCSDDGEPSGTAGKPMLDVLLGEEIRNLLVVVTRYFGGTLLGTGGLVKAYTKAVQEGLRNSLILWKYPAKKIHIETNYNGIGKIQYIVGQMNITVIDTEYAEKVDMILLIPNQDLNAFSKKVTEATAAQAVIEIIEEVWFGIVNGEPVMIEK